ncbi:MAG: hypothetical protein AAGC68_04925, partial [Verrucomicrobiota bacterium]
MDDIGMMGGDVIFFPGIFGDLKELERLSLPGADRLEVPMPDGLLETALEELPVEKLVTGLRLTLQRGKNGNAVDLGGRINPRQVRRGG